ncbi:glutamate decarboxylase gad1 [Basidiobolus ranarum]|uniref:Glutamate decarboxylase n=1 Tax=Basidiobolus ranarum TaxID=34480 RepID=A0ABR2VU36_9FUNG
MSLVKHIDPEKLVEESRGELLARKEPHLHSFAYGTRYASEGIPKFKMPEKSTPAGTVYRICRDDMELDGRALMNCATFLTTWMEPEADKLIMDSLPKNFVNQEELTGTQMIHQRCISILSHLWKIPESHQAIGTATVGSSEGVMLGGLAMKWKWKERRQKKGKDTSKPNIVFGANAQIALEKFARYFDVEPRIVKVSEQSNYVSDPEEVVKLCDENTIGVYSILGSTFTGHFEPIDRLAKLLDEYEKETGNYIPIHVDGASGAFIAPFSYPDLKWSFEIPRVVSINASGHKYGLSYPGIGWVLWRGEEYLSKDLIFEMDYLGGSEQTFTLNFSRPACFVISQYYNFLRLGIEGYTEVMETCLQNARLLSVALDKSGYFSIVSNIHIKKNQDGEVESAKDFHEGLPLVAFKLSESFKKSNPHVRQKAVSGLLQMRYWMLPSYKLPSQSEEVIRVVVRESMTEELIDRLVNDIMHTMEVLETSSQVEAEAYAECIGAKPDDKANSESTNEQITYSRPC